MATLRQKQIEELKRLTQEVIEDESVSVKDFAVFVQTIVDFIKQTKDDFKTELSSMKQALADETAETRSKLEQKVEQNLSTGEAKIETLTRMVTEAISGIEHGYTPQKGIDYEDGKDADPEQVSELVIAKLFPKVATKEELASLLEVLEDLKQMKEDIEAIKNRPMQIPTITGGIGGSTGRNFFKNKDISGDLDGVTKTFNIGAFYTIITVSLSSFPSILRPTIDYTWDSNLGTITFTSEIDAASSLATGQTCVISLVVN